MIFDFDGIAEGFKPGKILTVVARASQPAREAGKDACSTTTFRVKARVFQTLDTK